MPHIIMKIAVGKTADEKFELAQALTAAVTSTLDCDENSSPWRSKTSR